MASDTAEEAGAAAVAASVAASLVGRAVPGRTSAVAVGEDVEVVGVVVETSCTGGAELLSYSPC